MKYTHASVNHIIKLIFKCKKMFPLSLDSVSNIVVLTDEMETKRQK